VKTSDEWLTELTRRTPEFKRGSDTAIELRAMIAHIQTDAAAAEREKCAQMALELQDSYGSCVSGLARRIRERKDE
jgi:hypothetical protein